MISLNKCTGSFKVLSPKLSVPKVTKYVNVKAFDMVTNKNEAKAMTDHISYDCKCRDNSAICNSNHKWNNKTCQCECKSYRTYKKDLNWKPNACIFENIRYLKITSVTEGDEIITVMDIV